MTDEKNFSKVPSELVEAKGPNFSPHIRNKLPTILNILKKYSDIENINFEDTDEIRTEKILIEVKKYIETSYQLCDGDISGALMGCRKKWNEIITPLETTMSWGNSIGSVFSLALLSHIYPSAIRVLYQLLENDCLSVRTSSALAILYLGFQPPKVDMNGLEYFIDRNLFFKLSYPIYIRLVSGMKTLVRDNPNLADLLQEKLEDGDILHEGLNDFYDTEIAYILAENNRFSITIVDELSHFRKEHDHWHDLGSMYREKCHALLAYLLTTNTILRKMVFERFDEDGEYLDIRRFDGIGGWDEIFEKMASPTASQEVVEFLFSIEKLCRERDSKRSAIRTIISIFNNNPDLAKKNDDILTEYLKDDNYTYSILEAIIKLNRITPNMLYIVTQMADDNRFRLHLKAQETLDKWKSKGDIEFL